ncbi:9664_t:CDS:2, partial [Funneliformis mosseae]
IPWEEERSDYYNEGRKSKRICLDKTEADPRTKGMFFPVELEEMDSTNIKENSKLSTEFYKHLTKYYDKETSKSQSLCTGLSK